MTTTTTTTANGKVIQIMARIMWKQQSTDAASWETEKSDYYKIATKTVKSLQSRGLAISEQAS